MQTIKIKLEGIQRSEVRWIINEMEFEQGYRKAVQEYDSSSHPAEQQLLHKIMQLRQSVAGENHDVSLHDLLKTTLKSIERGSKNDEYEIPVQLLPVLIAELNKQIQNKRSIVKHCYGNPESRDYNPEMIPYKLESASALEKVVADLKEALD